MDALTKKPTQDLINEHGGIMLMLRIMEKIAGKLKNGDEVDKEHLAKVVEFLKNFADKCHHGKEEGILFPELIKNPANEKLVNELLGEHKTGRDFIRGIAESLDNYQKGNSDAFHIAVNALDYTQLLAEHIKKENTVLFPVADKELSDEMQTDIRERFEKLETEVIGAGKHEEYHRWLEELRSAYLG
jgi:hemerythrin-like domain-containing protein